MGLEDQLVLVLGFLGPASSSGRRAECTALTTAAASWAAAAIGALSGGGLYLAAALIAVLTLIVLELHQVGFLRRLSEPGESPRHD